MLEKNWIGGVGGELEAKFPAPRNLGELYIRPKVSGPNSKSALEIHSCI